MKKKRHTEEQVRAVDEGEFRYIEGGNLDTRLATGS